MSPAILYVFVCVFFFVFRYEIKTLLFGIKKHKKHTHTHKKKMFYLALLLEILFLQGICCTNICHMTMW